MAFGAGFKVAGTGASAIGFDWPNLIAVVSVASMTVGNLSALWQTNVKRMLAYSSIAHAGYLLMAVAVLVPDGKTAQCGPLMFYFVAYLFMNLGAFYVITLVESAGGGTTISSFRGFGRKAPFLGICLSVFVLSLLGIPPTAGFTGKFQLFMSVIDHRIYWLAVAAGINTAISAFYYFKLLKAMYLEDTEAGTPSRFALAPKLLVAALAIPVIYLGFDFNRVVQFTERFGL